MDKYIAKWYLLLSELGIVNYANIKQLSSRMYSLNHIGPYMVTNGLNKTIFILKIKMNSGL